MDAARVLRAVMGSDRPRLVLEEQGSPPSSPAVAAVVELAGGRALAEGPESHQQTRVLAFAELLEAGIRPLMIEPQTLEGVAEEALGRLTTALRDHSPRVRRSLCDVVAAMGGEGAVGLLLSMLHDPAPELRARAAEALGSLKAASASSELSRLLRDPITEVRAAAASALAEVGGESNCAAVIGALAEECRREDGAQPALAAMIDAIARLSDGGRPELAEALVTLPRPLASRLTASLEKNGVIERWLREEERKDEDGPLARLLARAAELGVVRPFLEVLDCEEERVRLRSAAALGHSRHEAALPAVAALLNHPEASVRAEAVRSVAEQGGPLALAPLAKAAVDPEGAVRLAAISGLKKVLAGRPAWPGQLLPDDFDLQASLADCQRAVLLGAGDSEEAVRVEAAGALGLIGSAEVAEALVGLAIDDSLGAVREAASESLIRAGFPQARRLLAAALEDENEGRRARAIGVLGALGSAAPQGAQVPPEAGGGRLEVARHVVDALSDPSAQVRESALAALSQMELTGGREWLPHHLSGRLGQELRNPDAKVRAAVAALLAKVAAPEVIEALVQALSDPEEEVRVNAVGALAAHGQQVAKHRALLADRLNDPSPRVREAAAAALDALRTSRAQAPEPMAPTGEEQISPAGVARLVDMAAGGDLEALLRALESSHSAQLIVTYLGGPGRGKLGPLLSGLRQADERDRTWAFGALSHEIRQTGLADSYLAELKALNPEVRAVAVEIAGLLATPKAAAALVEVLERDPVPGVRGRAASFLAEIPGEAGQAALLRAQSEDPDEVVRRVAAQALQGHPRGSLSE
jgi:HEAT repeat protein